MSASASTSIWETIANTPWWVFVIFFYLTWIGLLATKPSTIRINQLLIFSIIFFCGSMVCLLTLQFHLITLLFWLAALGIGIASGWLQFSFTKLTFLKNENKLQVPGSWNLLIILFLFLATKYYYRYELALIPNMLSNPFSQQILIIIYGAITGVFVGRWLWVKQRFFR